MKNLGMVGALALTQIAILTGVDEDGDELAPAAFSSREAAVAWINEYGDPSSNEYELTIVKIDSLHLEDEDTNETVELEDLIDETADGELESV